MRKSREKRKHIKAVIWDLDGTLWEGILLEDKTVRLKPGIKEVIETLDSRGILHSISSRNNEDEAMQTVSEFGLSEYFLYPQINWNAKSVSIKKIQKNLNIGMDTIMFVDDQPFDRDEVQYVYPEVLCVDSSRYKTLPKHPLLNPRFLTEDSKKRRLMYRQDVERKKAEQTYSGPRKEFLSSLNIKLIITEGKEDDLKRAEELVVRTNQLNTTGRTYDYYELKNFFHSNKHKLYFCGMEDRYGFYGKVGLALIEITQKFWYLRLFLTSCRVMSYGVGTVFLSHIMRNAKMAGKKLGADFKDTGRNKQMYVTLKFANFVEKSTAGKGSVLLENDLSFIQKTPDYIDLSTE